MAQRRLLLAQCCLIALGGCGFKLRGAADLAFKSLYIDVSESSSFGNELKRTLSSLGTVQVIDDPRLRASAQAILEILSDQRDRTVVAQNTTGQVREFQLAMRVRFRLRAQDGKELLPDTELQQLRDISFNETAVLAKESEQGLMYRDMQNEIVQQLMRRLAAVRVL